LDAAEVKAEPAGVAVKAEMADPARVKVKAEMAEPAQVPVKTEKTEPGAAAVKAERTAVKVEPVEKATTAATGPLSVLVDVREQPVIRALLGRLLASSTELQVPGIDYSFGRQLDGGWRLGNVLLERKTVFDFAATISCQRGEFQARVHERLMGVGFRVAIIVEGVNELKQHPQQDHLLTAAYSGKVDVLTTASLTDTAEFLTGMAMHARLHENWAVGDLQDLLRPLYQVDPVVTFVSALTALGIARSIAENLSRGYGALHSLLEQLPGPKGDAEAAVMNVAEYGGLTLYQAGKVLRAMGVENAPLLRKRRTRASIQAPQPWEQPQAWKWLPDEMQGATAQGAEQQQPQPSEQAPAEEEGEDEDEETQGQDAAQEIWVEAGPKTNRRIVKYLKSVLPRVDESRDLQPGTLRVCRGAQGSRGTPVRVFAVGDGSSFEPGKHWLVVPGALDWREVARSRAKAYAQHAVVSSICASPEQAARHVAGCVLALRPPAEGSAPGSSRRGPTGGRGAGGLVGVLGLARTAAGALPAAVAGEVARRARCTSVLQLLHKLREESNGRYLSSLGVRDFGPERAAAVRALFLGKS